MKNSAIRYVLFTRGRALFRPTGQQQIAGGTASRRTMPRSEAQDIASTFSAEIKAYTDKVVAAGHDRPKLVGFLANDDKAAVMYARWTEKACTRDGICYELRRVEKHALEAAVIEANTDPSVHGIMVYYPCFGGAIDDCEPPRAQSC